MSVFKIAWRSIQHRGLGSLLTILSMALGVMLVVSVLSIHGLISESFRSNSSFGYNILVGARGGSLQLTMNTVYYLSQPVENVPYEFYLAFSDQAERERAMKNSFAYKAAQNELDTLQFCSAHLPGASNLAALVALSTTEQNLWANYLQQSEIDADGKYKKYTDVAIPLCLGDSYEIDGSDTFFRCVGTTPDFFTKLVLDIDTEEKFKFSDGRPFENQSEENSYFECVIGALVAKKSGLKVGEVLYPTHGDPNDTGAKIHAQGFRVVGILEGTRTPHDRAVFLNMEGFFLMEDHSKPVGDDSNTDVQYEAEEAVEQDENEDAEFMDEALVVAASPNKDLTESKTQLADLAAEEKPLVEDSSFIKNNGIDKSSPLPIEQREVTSILVRTAESEDDFDSFIYSYILPQKINNSELETTLRWSNFRPIQAQKAAQAINPVMEVTKFFTTFIGPMQWLLLALTTMICIVSAISIMVGIYNSMSQRKHEIAVMRALGASRGNVMSVMLVESVLLAFAGGLLGWLAGHALNVGISDFVESRTGVGIGFFDFAPAVPVFAPIHAFLQDNMGGSFLPEWLIGLNFSPEFLLIPGLIFLAVLVGIYPSISAYRTDVAKALG